MVGRMVSRIPGIMSQSYDWPRLAGSLINVIGAVSRFHAARNHIRDLSLRGGSFIQE
jgi:hypothetical protein